MTRSEIITRTLDMLIPPSLPPSLSHLSGPLDRLIDEKIDMVKERAERIARLNSIIWKLSEQLIWNDYAQSTRVKKRKELERLLVLWKSEQ